MKSLRLLLLLLMLSFTGIIKADELVIQDFQLLPEQQTSVAVELNNTDRQYIMLDFFIQLPSGVTIARDEDDELMYELNSTRARRSHSLDIREQSNGSYRVLIYSTSKEALKGTSGAVFTMTLEADASATSGDYTGALTNQLAMDINNNKLNFPDKSFNVLIKSVQQPQSLSLEDLPVMTYGDAAYTLPDKTDQNQTLTWSSNNSSVATISGNTLTVKGAGAATITASQVGSESYTPFSKTFTLTVNKAALTVTADDCSRMEGAANPAFTISYSGFKYNDNASSLTTRPTAVSEATTSSPAGTYPITVSGGSSDNYEFNYVNGTLTVTAKNNQTISLSSIPVMTYGDDAYNLPSATDQGLALTWTCSNTSVATVSGNTLTVKGAGVATITASQAGNGTYNSFSKTFTLTVNKTPLTITADDKTKTAGQANPSLTVSYSGFVNGESSSVLTTQPTVTTTAIASSAAGTYPITVSGAAAANYEIIYVEGTLTVVKADQTVTLTAIPTMTYGDAAYTLPAKTAQNQTLTWASNNTNVATTSGNTLTVKGAGTATITASQAGNETYNPFSKTFTLTVNKAALTVTADDCSRMEGAANPAFTISYSGFKYNDNASSLTTQPTAASEATTSSPAGTYPITVSGGSSDNYEFNYVNGTLTVTAKNNQTISLSSIPVMTYGDDAYNLPSTTVQGLALTWSSNNTSVATVSGNTLTVKGAGETSVTAANDGDATHSPFSKSYTLTVNKAALTVTADDCSKMEGAANPAFTISYSGFKYNDNASSLTTQPTAVSEATTSSPAGTYPITVSGGESDNYEFNYVNGTLTVTEDNEDLYIQFADANVKALCVANWDTNGDGELSMDEAAAVTDLGSVFNENKKITSFDELQYFMGLTSIGSSAFYFCKGLTSITIPSSVTSIGDQAFSLCSGLTSITIPSSVTSIGDKAFSFCSGLTSITIPSSVTSIGDRAFISCSGLASISVDSSNQYYNDGNGSKCIIETSTNTLVAGCKNTVIPSSVTSIGSMAFYDCTGLTSITIPSSVTSIGNYAFYGCRSLSSITIPNSVTTIGIQAFHGDKDSQTSIVVESGNIVYDSRNNCNALIETSTNTLIKGCRNTVIPKDVVAIGDWAFSNCSSLTSITIPNSVTSIGDGVFYGCTGLTSITIPNRVTTIGAKAFKGCNSLTLVRLYSNSIVSNTYTDSSNLKDIFGNQVQTYILGSGVTSIGDYAFNQCNNISISIGGKVKSIGEYAFYGCTGLTSMTFKDGTSIGDYAFYGCTGLTSMTFKDGMSIGDYAFCDCSGLTSIIMPDCLDNLGNYAFARCGLTSVVIPRCSSIGKYCFSGCTSLLSVKFGNGNNINAIPEGMFSSCRSLTSLGVIGSGASIEIPNSVSFINKYAFRGCSGLTSVTIPNSVTQVYQVSAFTGCTGLENLVIGNGLTSIPSGYFMDCKNLKSVTIGTSVTSIGALAFYNSSKLAQVRVCNPTPITISDLVFPYRSTATLVVPSREAKSAYKAADYWKDFKLILFEGEDFSNVLEVSDMVVDHGAFAELPVNMTNQDKITAVEFDLEMPSGVKLLSCSLTERKGDHGINYAQSENGSYHVMIFSLSSSVFTGSTGDLFTLHLLADSLGQHIIAVKNVELSTNDGDKRTPQDISASVTICDIPIGDVNGDGEVTITDAVSIVNHRLNRTPVRFISAAADLNADNEITITDAVRIVNMILSDQSNAKLRTESAISLPEPQ